MARTIFTKNEIAILEAARNGIEKFRRGWSHTFLGPFYAKSDVERLCRRGFVSGMHGVASRHLYTNRAGLEVLAQERAAQEGLLADLRHAHDARYGLGD